VQKASIAQDQDQDRDFESLGLGLVLIITSGRRKPLAILYSSIDLITYNNNNSLYTDGLTQEFDGGVGTRRQTSPVRA